MSDIVVWLNRLNTIASDLDDVELLVGGWLRATRGTSLPLLLCSYFSILLLLLLSKLCYQVRNNLKIDKRQVSLRVFLPNT